MNRITTICDICKKEEERPRGWIEAGGWFKGHSLDLVEIYLNFAPEPPNDADEHYHFCCFEHLSSFLAIVNNGRLQSANAGKAQATNNTGEEHEHKNSILDQPLREEEGYEDME